MYQDVNSSEDKISNQKSTLQTSERINYYQLDRQSSSAFLSVLISLFYSKYLCKYLWKNYNSNIVIYLQEYLSEIFSDIKAKKITYENTCYIIELLRSTEVPLKILKSSCSFGSINSSVSTLRSSGYGSNIIKDILTYLMRLFEISFVTIDINIKTNVLDNSPYYAFLSCGEKNILDLYNEWDKENHKQNVITHDFLFFFINKDKNTKINIQRKVTSKKNTTNIKYYFKGVICYSQLKCTYYAVIKLLSNYYLFDPNDNEQLRKITITKLSDNIKTECVGIIYKK